MAGMAKVKLGSEDYRGFERAAAAAGTSVQQWLVEAGRAQALAQEITRGQRAARIITVPVDAATAAALDDETDRGGIRDWALAASYLRAALVARPVPGVEGSDGELRRVWAAALDDLAPVLSAQQRAYLRLARMHAVVGDTALVTVPDTFTRDVIELSMRTAIGASLSRSLSRPVQVAVTVTPALPAHERTDAGAGERAIQDHPVRSCVDALSPCLQVLPVILG